MEQNVTKPAELPRSITHRIRWRAWVQPYVRFWWVLALVLMGVALALGLAGASDWNHERWLIVKGVGVDATVEQAADQTIAGRKQPPDSLCILKFPWRGEEHLSQPQRLAGREQYVAAGDRVKIFVNPDNPDDWTARNTPGPLGPRLLGALISLIAGLIALAISGVLWSRVLGVWRTGEALEALVVESGNSAIAPFSRALRCTPAAQEDPRVFHVFLPGAAKVEAGSRIWVLARRGKVGGAQALDWFG